MNATGKAILKTLQFIINVFTPPKKKIPEPQIEEKEIVEEV